jgi:hypothetical protein
MCHARTRTHHAKAAPLTPPHTCARCGAPPSAPSHARSYTWLQHTNSDVPHYPSGNFSFIKGALHSIDRPYGAVIDFLHHRIGSTHVAHHVEAKIPHYHAREATEAMKAAFPEVYLYDPTPVPLALWVSGAAAACERVCVVAACCAGMCVCGCALEAHVEVDRFKNLCFCGKYTCVYVSKSRIILCLDQECRELFAQL